MSQHSGGVLTRSERLAEQVAGSRVGRALLSVGLVILVGSLIAWNLPPGVGPASATETSTLRHNVLVVGAPVIYALGLDQNWAVFSPPRVQVIALEARTTFKDGTRTVWRPPTSTGALFGAYRDYRWGKLVEAEIEDANSGLWEPFASWIARREAAAGRRPVTVELIRRFYNIEPIVHGSSGRGPWMHFRYFVYHVPAGQQ